jgi:hypothetical protein
VGIEILRHGVRGCHEGTGRHIADVHTKMIRVGEEIIADKNQRFRVLDVVVFEEEDESPFVGLLQVEAA